MILFDSCGPIRLVGGGWDDPPARRILGGGNGIRAGGQGRQGAVGGRGVAGGKASNFGTHFRLARGHHFGEDDIHRIGRMGKDGRAIAFVTPEQGGRLTDIECFINKQIEEDFIEGFQAYTPREVRKQQAAEQGPDGSAEPEAPKPTVPVFGRRVKRYSNRL